MHKIVSRSATEQSSVLTQKQRKQLSLKKIKILASIADNVFQFAHPNQFPTQITQNLTTKNQVLKHFLVFWVLFGKIINIFKKLSKSDCFFEPINTKLVKSVKSDAIIEMIQARRSVRAYRKELPLTEEDKTNVYKIFKHSGTAKNCQSISLHIVEDADLLYDMEKLACETMKMKVPQKGTKGPIFRFFSFLDQKNSTIKNHDPKFKTEVHRQ